MNNNCKESLKRFQENVNLLISMLEDEDSKVLGYSCFGADENDIPRLFNNFQQSALNANNISTKCNSFAK